MESTKGAPSDIKSAALVVKHVVEWRGRRHRPGTSAARYICFCLFLLFGHFVYFSCKTNNEVVVGSNPASSKTLWSILYYFMCHCTVLLVLCLCITVLTESKFEPHTSIICWVMRFMLPHPSVGNKLSLSLLAKNWPSSKHPLDEGSISCAWVASCTHCILCSTLDKRHWLLRRALYKPSCPACSDHLLKHNRFCCH